MDLFKFPLEIRLQIYSEILVQDNPIEFNAHYGPLSPHLMKARDKAPDPALLRVNKAVNREGTPLLYSYNRFRFPDAFGFGYSVSGFPDDGSTLRYIPHIAPFLGRSGDNARLLRHICIDYPDLLAFTDCTEPVLTEEYVQVLRLIRESCPGLRTVEIECGPLNSKFSLDEIDLGAGVLRVLDEGFKAMTSLERIVIVGKEYENREITIGLRESLTQRLPSGKWSIEIRKLPPKRWYSDDGRFQFDNYHECWAYNVGSR